MATDIETRVERLLDKLENPNLLQAEARELERRIDYLQGLAAQQE